MDENVVRGLINQLLYGVDQFRDLTAEAAVEHCAERIIGQRYFRQPAEWYKQALEVTLNEGSLPVQWRDLSRRFSETELLEYLARLDGRLDELRPWPRPRFLKLDISEWNGFGDAEPLATINRPAIDVIGLLNRGFDPVPTPEGELPVMILRLRSGEVVALIGSIDHRSTVFTLVSRDPGDAVQVIDHFCRLTGFAADEVLPLAG